MGTSSDQCFDRLMRHYIEGRCDAGGELSREEFGDGSPFYTSAGDSDCPPLIKERLMATLNTVDYFSNQNYGGGETIGRDNAAGLAAQAICNISASLPKSENSFDFSERGASDALKKQHTACFCSAIGHITEITTENLMQKTKPT